MSDWPKYQSHKIVQAVQIIGFDTRDTGGKVCAVVEGDEPFVPNELGMLERASVGDYAMLYPDGYRSISPKIAFEEGYTLCQTPTETL